jgi:F-type H+-transporting ATPase subunit gamma
MAGASSKEIKNRIRSMSSTRQITKAMEMVAASKLRRAQAQMLSSRPYFETLYETLQNIVDHNDEMTSPYLQTQTGGKSLYVVIAGDRGLAGGYNSNILKLCLADMEGQDAVVLPIGRKATEFYNHRNVSLFPGNPMDTDDLSASDCFSLAKQICKAFLSGEYRQVRIGYTNFVSVLSQTPAILQALPLLRQETRGKATSASQIVYEPDSATVFETIVPEYVGGILYGALCESRCAEQAARRTAMDAATQNADEMIADLNLKYNQARQAAITQEITEIVAGS